MSINFQFPVKGKLIDVEKLSDPVFAQKMMGDSIAFSSDNGIIYSPVDGTINMVFPTKHALGITTNEGLEILLHIGIDTVNLKGNGFEVLVKENQKIKANEKIIAYDKNLLASKNINDSVIFVLTSGGQFQVNNEEISVLYEG